MVLKSFFLIFQVTAKVAEGVVLVVLFLLLRQRLVVEEMMKRWTAVLSVKEPLIESWGSF